MKKLVIGILAHVDAGKTTLSEAMLYVSGKIKKLGRVDNKDAYLDTNALEKERGITIFSKQAMLEVGDTQFILLDTPGHVDFSAEMERTLQVLDYAILVISGPDGIQGHTHTLWRLLKMYHIPTFIFINKMDQPGTDAEVLLQTLKDKLDDGCFCLTNSMEEQTHEEIAMCHESLMEAYLAQGELHKEQIIQAISKRWIFPCFFGSALKLQGVEELLQALAQHTQMPFYDHVFGAKVFKVTRDDQGNRLTHMKITGGKLKVKDTITGCCYLEESNCEEEWKEKVNQIRLYSGQKFEKANEVEAGMICTVVGLSQTKAGEGLGKEYNQDAPVLEPVLSYRIILPDEIDPKWMLPRLRELEEEAPELHIIWDTQHQEIKAQLMGEVQIEILERLILERFKIQVKFDVGTILYKETIQTEVEGVGHFEPLRHYAEVHVILTPGEIGSGLIFETNCSEDLLDKNWQRLVLTHLQEKRHCGVLTGSPITDMKITLVSGRAHKKHTEGGDFREATYRSVRQGLKQAQSILLEPFYDFRLELPEKMVGRAMVDVEKMQGSCKLIESKNGYAILIGKAPVSTMQNYQKDVIAYTKGEGKLFCNLAGYFPCHNAEEIIERISYEAERDTENPTGSVFCSHGTGFLVPWNEVPDYMHLPYTLQVAENEALVETVPQEEVKKEEWIGLDEIDQILNKTFYANQGDKSGWKKRKTAREDYYNAKPSKSLTSNKKENYLLVDGYNIIFAWPDLKELAIENMEGAKIKLLEQLCNYQGSQNTQIMVVFDAYRVKGHYTEISSYYQLLVVYTKEAETADHYIEKFAHQHHEQYDVTVATSDGLEQVIIRGKGCKVVSARELKERMEQVNREVLEAYKAKQVETSNQIEEKLSLETKEKLEQLRLQRE